VADDENKEQKQEPEVQVVQEGSQAVNTEAIKPGVDQSKHNLPIDPEMEDMLALLEKSMNNLSLSGDEQDLLRHSLKSGRFSKGASLV